MNEKVCRLVEVGVGRWNSQHCIWEVQLVIITTKPEMEAGGVQVWMPAWDFRTVVHLLNQFSKSGKQAGRVKVDAV